MQKSMLNACFAPIWHVARSVVSQAFVRAAGDRVGVELEQRVGVEQALTISPVDTGQTPASARPSTP